MRVRELENYRAILRDLGCEEDVKWTTINGKKARIITIKHHMYRKAWEIIVRDGVVRKPKEIKHS